MSDRLPSPLEELHHHGAERASATPARTGPKRVASTERVVAAMNAGTLRDLQQAFMTGIAGSERDADVASTLVRDARASSARDRFDIYRFGYRARLVECLVDDYPVLREVLGEERFEALASAYVERYPSASPSLNFFGRRLSAFVLELDADRALASFGSKANQRFFSELSALEWAIVDAIHAAPAASFDATVLQAIAPERLGDARLTESGTAQLLRFEHPVNAFYQAVRVSTEAPDVPAPLASATVVYRLGLTIWRMDLTPAMTRVLGALLAGATIGESVARIGVDESDPAALGEAERSVMVWFREWVRAGFFSGVTIDDA